MTEVYQAVIVFLVSFLIIFLALAFLYRWKHVVKKKGIGIYEWIRNHCNDAGSSVTTDGACAFNNQKSNVRENNKNYWQNIPKKSEKMFQVFNLIGKYR